MRTKFNRLLVFTVLLAFTSVAQFGCADTNTGMRSGDPQQKDPKDPQDPKTPTTPKVDPKLLNKDVQSFQEQFAKELDKSKDWTLKELADEYPQATKSTTLGYDALAAGYADKITSSYQLNKTETDRLSENGFVVTERQQWHTFGWAYQDIFVKELPLFISADSVLHALHKSFSELLKLSEQSVLFKQVDQYLNDTHDALGQLDVGGLSDAARDVDMFFTVAKSLLSDSVAKSHTGTEVDTQVAEILDAVKEERMLNVNIFGATRKMDFSQFKPRGHYTENEVLRRYFKAMMWLGRIDFRFREFDSTTGKFIWHDRQIQASWIIHNATQNANSLPIWRRVTDLIGLLIGPPDAMDLNGWEKFAADANIKSNADLEGDLSKIYEQLEQGRYGAQRINSHYLSTNPLSAETTPLPLSFLVMGQRFVVDSYVFSNVVYDNIVSKNAKIPRAMPDPLDAMFVLGSNEALPLLEKELSEYNYAGNLHSLRYLVDGYGEDFWSESTYNLWLSALRSLNHLPENDAIPAPMKTAAWRHKTLNTQLASWAELRHDTLLYAKQSYTGAVGCEYPEGYVEPYPAMYARLGEIAAQLEVTLVDLPFENKWFAERLIEWASHFRSTMGHLESMAQKQLNEEPFNETETALFKAWIKIPQQGMCGGPSFTGHFPRLYLNETHAEEYDAIVADVHTNPNTNAPLGPPRVLHVGTGKVDLMVLTRQTCEGTRAYVGPVSSYYQHHEPGLVRLTDDEWRVKLNSDDKPERPEWTQSYLVTNK